MNWANLWATLRPVLVEVITKVIIPILIGSAGGLATYHAACQPVVPAQSQPAGCDCGK